MQWLDDLQNNCCWRDGGVESARQTIARRRRLNLEKFRVSGAWLIDDGYRVGKDVAIVVVAVDLGFDRIQDSCHICQSFGVWRLALTTWLID